jgi:hypothetical protein
MTIIHVNRNVIDQNKKNNTTNPVLSVKNKKSNVYCSRADILDDNGKVVASVIYSPDKPLKCGAKVWIETKNKVITSG